MLERVLSDEEIQAYLDEEGDNMIESFDTFGLLADK